MQFARKSSGRPSENLKYSILLNKLKNTQFLIVKNDPVQVDLHSSAQNANKLKALLGDIWKKPYCPVKHMVEKMDNCIPDKINYVILQEGKRENGCIPVIRRIRYLEASKHEGRDFEQNVYQMKSKEFVVAYIAAKSDWSKVDIIWLMTQLQSSPYDISTCSTFAFSCQLHGNMFADNIKERRY